jgi:phosphatidate cytidylyltransferase
VKARALSALIFVPPVLLILVVGGIWVPLVVGLLVVLASIEVFRLLPSAGLSTHAWLGVAATLVVAADAAQLGDLPVPAMLPTALAVVVLAIVSFRRPDPRDGFSSWVGTLFGAAYVGLLGFVVLLAFDAPPLASDAPAVTIGSQRLYLALLVFGVWSYDTGAYLVGRTFGRRKFLTHISASKTWAGLVGGVAAATVVVTAAWWAAGQPVMLGIPLGIALALAAQAGDLAESMLKRAAGVKDSSNLIPGHGGVLDRIDSFLFAAPVVALYVHLVVP